jgi:hypothetical protein
MPVNLRNLDLRFELAAVATSVCLAENKFKFFSAHFQKKLLLASAKPVRGEGWLHCPGTEGPHCKIVKASGLRSNLDDLRLSTARRQCVVYQRVVIQPVGSDLLRSRSMLLLSFLERFVRTFRPEPFRQLARQTLWSQRTGKIDPFEFLTSLVFGQMAASRPTLTAQAQSLAEPVTRQAVDQRFNAHAVEYLQAAFHWVLAEVLAWVPTHPQARQLQAHFSALYLIDSTSFDCADSLAALFPACGGAGSPANVKVMLRYEVMAGRLEPLELLAGKRSDQGQALKVVAGLCANELALLDKGFFTAEAWQAATRQGAFLLMPLPHAVTLWLPAPPDQAEQPVDLAAVLAASPDNRVSWPALLVGGPRHRAGTLRLVAFRLSPESAGRQRQGLRASMRKRGRVPTVKALELAGWMLLLTNAPADKLPTTMLSYVYRLRWQIELIFRQAKSVLRLDRSESENPHRIQTEIWARLIGAVLLFSWHAQASAECWQRYHTEASFEKLIRLMQQWGLTLARAFLAPTGDLLSLLRTIWKQIMTNARKGREKSRRTTWENLFNLWLNPLLAQTTSEILD